MLKEKSKTKKVSELQATYFVNFPEASAIAKPFLKWAGGKGQLLETLADLFPPEIHSGEIKKYAEPFIGGGALFFSCCTKLPTD